MSMAWLSRLTDFKIFWQVASLDVSGLRSRVLVWFDAVQNFCAGFSRKVNKMFLFFVRHFYTFNNLGSIITQDYVKRSYGCYDMPHVALGYVEKFVQVLVKKLRKKFVFHFAFPSCMQIS